MAHEVVYKPFLGGAAKQLEFSQLSDCRAQAAVCCRAAVNEIYMDYFTERLVT